MGIPPEADEAVLKGGKMLTERKLRILEAIINDFLESAQPVGSRTISKKYLLGISPATIRNEMADLEELGYLFQPHTSAGRVPSDLGYRFFVDTMLDFQLPAAGAYAKLRSLTQDRGTTPARRAAELLAEQTGSIAVVSTPSFGKAKLENLKIVKVHRSKALMILVAGEGKLRYVELESDLTQGELDRVAATFLESFYEKSVEEIDVRAVQKSRQSGLEYLIPAVREALKGVRTSEIIVSSSKGLLRNEDITSTEQLKEFMNIVDNHEVLSGLFQSVVDGKEHQPGIRIGSELENEVLQDYAIVCANFGYRDSDRGYIGIIGPKRMNYEYNGALVVAYANALTEAYSGIYL